MQKKKKAKYRDAPRYKLSSEIEESLKKRYALSISTSMKALFKKWEKEIK